MPNGGGQCQSGSVGSDSDGWDSHGWWAGDAERDGAASCQESDSWGPMPSEGEWLNAPPPTEAVMSEADDDEWAVRSAVGSQHESLASSWEADPAGEADLRGHATPHGNAACEVAARFLDGRTYTRAFSDDDTDDEVVAAAREHNVQSDEDEGEELVEALRPAAAEAEEDGEMVQLEGGGVDDEAWVVEGPMEWDGGVVSSQDVAALGTINVFVMPTTPAQATLEHHILDVSDSLPIPTRQASAASQPAATSSRPRPRLAGATRTSPSPRPSKSDTAAKDAQCVGVLRLGAWVCHLRGCSTPVLHVRCADSTTEDAEEEANEDSEGGGETGDVGDPGRAASFYVLPAASGGLVCFTLERSTSATARNTFYRWLGGRATILPWAMPAWESELVTVAPATQHLGDSDTSPVLSATIQRSSRALQYLMIGSAKAVGITCHAVSYGANSLASAQARRAERLAQADALAGSQGMAAETLAEDGEVAGWRDDTSATRGWRSDGTTTDVGWKSAGATAGGDADSESGEEDEDEAHAGRSRACTDATSAMRGDREPCQSRSRDRLPTRRQRKSPSARTSAASSTAGLAADLASGAMTSDMAAEGAMIGPMGEPTHLKVRQGLEVTRAYLHHFSEVSDIIGRSVLHGGRHALMWTSNAVAVALPTPPADSVASRLWRERVAPPLFIAGAAITKPLAPLACTLPVCGRALLAAADTAVVARGLMYTSVRQASSDVARAVLGQEAGPVVAEGMDTLVAVSQTATSCNGIGWLVRGATTDSVALANNLLYVGVRHGSAEAAARRFGSAAAMVATDSLDNLKVNGISSTASNLPISSMSWALSAVSSQHQRRLLATPISHTADGSMGTPPARSNEGEADAEQEERVDEWILLGSPWLEGFVAVRGDFPTADPAPDNASSASAPNSSTPADSACHDGAPGSPGSPASWRRVWCVLQDSALAFYEHERAASAFNTTPLCVVEWLHVQNVQLHTPPPSRTGRTATSTQAAEHLSFEITLDDGRTLVMRADTPTQRAMWVREILRLTSWRAVHLLQLEYLGTEWQQVLMEDDESVSVPPPPLCSSPPSTPPRPTRAQ